MGSQFWQVVSRQVRVYPAFALALLLVTMPTKAQSYLESVGVSPFTTKLPVENGFINAANGNLHLEIPLGSFPQRGGPPDKIVLMYDSAFWSYAAYGYWQAINPSNQYAPVWGGWRIVTSRDPGQTTYSEYDYGNCAWAADSTYARYSPWIYVAPDGTQHTFPVTTLQPLYPGHCGNSGTPSAAGYANDGSGFYISITNYTAAVVHAPDGTILDTVVNGQLASEDTNGNYASYNYADTLGRTVLTQSVSSCCGLTNNVYTYGVPNSVSGSGTSYFTVRTGQINVCTNFQQQYVGEWCNPNLTIYVVNEVDLPDGTAYTFTYDSGTTAGHYGLLGAMTLPTGNFGDVYSSAVQTDAAGNHYNWINSRTAGGGTWNYAFQTLSTCASGYVDCQQQFTVTKPPVPPATSGDQTIYTFALNGGSWPVQVQYNDHVTGNLATTNQCFSFVNCTSGTYSYNVVAQAPATNVHLYWRTTTLPTPAGNVSTSSAFYWDNNDSGQYGEIDWIKEWNFGSSLSAAADRTTTIGYVSDSNAAYVNAHILNRPTSVTVTNSGGATVAQTLYTYDVYTYNGGTLASVTGSLGHDDTNYGTNNTIRGNVTLIQNLVSGSTYLNSYRNFDTTGQVTNAFDPSNQKTTNTYACQNAYPTTITNPLSQVTQIGYDCNTGLVTSIQDPNNIANNQSTSFNYDNMFRPLSIGYPDGGQTTIQYNLFVECQYCAPIYQGSTTTKKITSSLNLVTTDTVDGLGRVTRSVTTSDPDGNTTVTTSFDSNSRVQSVTTPYRGSSNGSESYVYDGLDRVQQITHADGHVSSIYYGASVGLQGGAASQLCASGTYGTGYPILKIDEANNKLQSWIDGFGRTIEADEPTATSASLTANTCYGYDANNNLTGVLAALGNQTRTFVYDGVSRLTKAINPETGGSPTPTVYTYDADTNCASPNSFLGDLVSTVDPRGIRTCMQYDALHRLTAKTYTDGTPAKYYSYDVAPSWMTDLTNVVGRRVEARNQFAGTTGAGTSTVNSYDAMGRVVRQWQQTPPIAPGGNFLYYTYDLLGNMASYTNGAGVTFTQSPFSGAGRLTQVTSSLSDANHPGTLLSNVHYNALGETTAATLGNGAVESLGYMPRGWPQTVTVVNQSQGTPGTGSVTINGSEQSYGGNGSQGPNGAGTGVDGGGGLYTWSSPGNITVADGVAATVSIPGTPTIDPSNYLTANNFGFTVPNNATINGIQVDVLRKSSGSNPDVMVDNSALIIKGGSRVGTDHGQTGTLWPTSFTYASYGNSTDLWGTTWQPADINASNFGFALQVFNDSVNFNEAAYVDFIRITVWYTTQTVYDSGTVSVTVNGTSTPPASYGNGSTAASLASQLASSISAFGFVTASASGNVISIQSTQTGSSTNYPLSASSQSNNGFNPPSFTPSPSGSNLAGGTGAPGTLYSFGLGYGAGNANVTSANDSVNGNWIFTYDNLNRLSTSNKNNNQLAFSYGYDQLGNRTSQTVTAGSGGNLSLTYAGNNNRMDGYTYDAAGNLKGDGLHTYAYDAENHLISVDNGTTATYVYDAEGRRVQKTAGTPVEYLYDLNGNIVTELSPAGVWNRTEIFTNGQHLATYLNGTTGPTYFDHADWLGTERARSNTADADCETITSLPFGDWQSVSGACADASPLHFTGQQRDVETSLDYFGARHYSSQFGRFMSPDPTGIFLGNLNDPQQLNLYSYVRNNPINTTDPSGLFCVSFGGGDCGGFDFPIVFSWGWGGGGHRYWDWGGGPSGPIYTPANVGTNPNPSNGTLTSDDPFGGETNGIPNGLRIPTLGLAGILLPSDPGCDFGGCGFTPGGRTWRNYADYLDWLLALQGPDASLVPGLELIRQQVRSYNACASAAATLHDSQTGHVSTIADQTDGMMGNRNPFGVGIVGPDPNSDPGLTPAQTSAGTWAFLMGNGWAKLTYHNNMGACASRNPLASLGQ